ncbi:expressed unknown protein [Seminavis robusta]|uniref:Uncharacterized protein n=1 Tax=Seminavis robusta TaxID=568900 RepID=A0A9N8HQI1_9STRA|nr:expressed unknown protein [Seminavis robusta]|eukprot:Sro1168_g248440.1 n/a (243) ;mRNA; r:3816-4544
MNKPLPSLVPCPTLLSVNVLWLVTTMGGIFGWLHQQDTNDISNLSWGIVIPLLFFNNLNIFVCFCEIALGAYHSYILRDYQQMKDRYVTNRDEGLAFLDLANMPIPWSRLFDPKLYCRMWASYCFLDAGYHTCESFAFWIDVGNGYSTAPCCLLMNAAIAIPQHVSPLLVGCVCLATYWQMVYGTLVYFTAYIWNKRYENKPQAVCWGIVGTANMIWIVFPAIGMYACVSILDKKDFSVLGY